MKISLPYVYSVTHPSKRKEAPTVTPMLDIVEADIPELSRHDVDIAATWCHIDTDSRKTPGFEALYWDGRLLYNVSPPGIGFDEKFLSLDDLSNRERWGRKAFFLWEVFGGHAADRHEGNLLTLAFRNPAILLRSDEPSATFKSTRDARARMAQECVDGLISVEGKIFRTVQNLHFRVNTVPGHRRCDIVAPPTGYRFEKVTIDTLNTEPPWKTKRYGLTERKQLVEDFPERHLRSFSNFALSDRYEERFDAKAELLAQALQYVLYATRSDVGTMAGDDIASWMVCRDAWSRHVMQSEDPRTPQVLDALRAVASCVTFTSGHWNPETVAAIIEDLAESPSTASAAPKP